MLAVERRNLILEKLQEDKKVIVSELSQEFQVSEETIRRDLDKLDKDGLAVKSYGGAVLNENTSLDMPFNIRKKNNPAGKQKIAKIVETLIEDGDHIILDPSTTAVFIAKALKQKERLTVITNSIEVILELSDVADWNIISSGGSLKEGYLALVGPRAIEGLGAFNVEKVVLSCKGLDMEKGITDGNELHCLIQGFSPFQIGSRLPVKDIPHILVKHVLAFFILQNGIKEKSGLCKIYILHIVFSAALREVGGEAVTGRKNRGAFLPAAEFQEFKSILRITALGINRKIGVASYGGSRLRSVGQRKGRRIPAAVFRSGRLQVLQDLYRPVPVYHHSYFPVQEGVIARRIDFLHFRRVRMAVILVIETIHQCQEIHGRRQFIIIQVFSQLQGAQIGNPDRKITAPSDIVRI